MHGRVAIALRLLGCVLVFQLGCRRPELAKPVKACKAGGVGKTRLAIDVASKIASLFADGVASSRSARAHRRACDAGPHELAVADLVVT